MATNKKIQDLTSYTGVLPYSSEIFGVYQPLIGWKSARKINRIRDAVRIEKIGLLSRLGRNLVSKAVFDFGVCSFAVRNLKPAEIAGPRLKCNESVVLRLVLF